MGENLIGNLWRKLSDEIVGEMDFCSFREGSDHILWQLLKKVDERADADAEWLKTASKKGQVPCGGSARVGT